jgi:hypothetical protein
MSTSEVPKFNLNARHRMAFHFLRLSAALGAFRSDTAGRRRWWIQNLELELVYITISLLAFTHNPYRQNNALAFVGLCSAQNLNVPVPNLIRLLAGALPSTDSDVLPVTSQIWEEVYPKERIPELHLAWWAYPGGSDGRLTFDELEEAFEQFLLQVRRMVNLGIRISTINAEFSKHDRKHTIVLSED